MIYISSRPLFHLFSSPENFYIYDSNTNEILKSDEDTWKELKTLKESDELLESELLERFQEEGLLKTPKLEKLDTGLSEQQTRRHLKENIENLELKVTENCNLGCDYCYYSEAYPMIPSFSEKNMSESIIKKSIDVFSDRSKKAINSYLIFYGGEPLLNMEGIREAVEYSEDLLGDDVTPFLVTNAVGMDEEVSKFLHNKDFLIQVSLDGPEEVHDKHRKYRNGSPTFGDVKENLTALKEMDEDFYEEKVKFNATLTPPYELIEIDDFFSNDELVKNNKLTANFVSDFGFDLDWDFSKDEKYREKTSELKKRYIDAVVEKEPERSKLTHAIFGELLGYIHIRRMRELDETHYPNGICIPGSKSMFVSPDGDIYVCERTEKDLKIGNVENEGFSEERALEIVDEYTEEKSDMCSECWGVRLCKNCYSFDMYDGKYNDDLMEKSCRGRRSSIDEALELYVSIREQDDEAMEHLDE